jgi:hypothetical protein
MVLPAWARNTHCLEVPVSRPPSLRGRENGTLSTEIAPKQLAAANRTQSRRSVLAQDRRSSRLPSAVLRRSRL